MGTIYGRLGFDTSYANNNVTGVANSSSKFIGTLPKLLDSSWQTTDVANNDVGGYYQNPVGYVTKQIWNSSNTIMGITNISLVANLSLLLIAANNLSKVSCNNFYQHTDRLSGVAPISAEAADLPHLSTALNTGQMLVYLTSQTDSVSNNSPIMGNFSSLTTNEQLTTYYNTIITYPTIILNSISANTTNLSPSIITLYMNKLIEISSFMDTRRNADVNFYTNSQAVISDYHTVKQFNKMGATHTYLVDNLIGTDKLKTRLNS
jgi:hypothetical protein